MFYSNTYYNIEDHFDAEYLPTLVHIIQNLAINRFIYSILSIPDGCLIQIPEPIGVTGPLSIIHFESAIYCVKAELSFIAYNESNEKAHCWKIPYRSVILFYSLIFHSLK